MQVPVHMFYFYSSVFWHRNVVALTCIDVGNVDGGAVVTVSIGTATTGGIALLTAVTTCWGNTVISPPGCTKAGTTDTGVGAATWSGGPTVTWTGGGTTGVCVETNNAEKFNVK